MNTSENANEIYTALAKAQAAIINPAKESENPHFKSRYADLATGLVAIRQAFAPFGLAFIQVTRMDGDVMMLATRLVHSSGQWIEGDYPVCKFPIAPQQAGSALTYARRYAIFAMTGIAGDDDDGTEANKSETPAPAKRQATPKINEAGRAYVTMAKTAILNCGERQELVAWWADETDNRAAAGVITGTQEWAELRAAWEAYGKDLAAKSSIKSKEAA